jgi:ankyrin repeat protein
LLELQRLRSTKRKFIEDALNNLPKTLDETYQRMLTNIDDRYVGEALNLLRWIAFANSPFTLAELNAATGITLSDDGEDEIELADDEDLQSPLTILQGLVVITFDGLNDVFDTVEQVRLAHFSVQEYLTSDRILSGPAKHFHLNKASCEDHVEQSCLAYLIHYSESKAKTGSLSADKAVFPLLLHAACWPVRLRRSGLKTERRALLLLSTNDIRHRWREIYDPDRYHGPLDKSGDGLYYACLLGLGGLVRTFLARGADINAQGGSLGNALQAAVSCGAHDIMQVLVDYGANVNTQHEICGDIPQAAARRGDYGIVQLLLEHGANVNTQDERGGSALQAAVSRGSHDIVQVLLDHGANVNARGGPYDNALQAAAERGDHKMVQLLLDHGANVNALNAYSGNALQAAAKRGDHEIVQILLDSGAYINAQGLGSGGSGNALEEAAARGHHKTVQVLLENRTSTSWQGEGSFGNALESAARKGYSEIVQVLLHYGGDTDVLQEGAHSNALHAAAKQGHHEIVQILLDNGADVNTRGRQYRSPLEAALTRPGNTATLRVLLDRGANVYAPGSGLSVAVRSQSQEIVKRLLGRGADIDAQGMEDDNALHTAVLKDDQPTVQNLFEKSAKTNTCGEHSTALVAAAQRGDEEMIKKLLDDGVDINLQGYVGSPLQVAAYCGKKAAVKILLDRGADVNARGNTKSLLGLALQEAMCMPSRHLFLPSSGTGYWNDRFDIARMLLNAGANANEVILYDSVLKEALDRGHGDLVPRLRAECIILDDHEPCETWEDQDGSY